MPSRAHTYYPLSCPFCSPLVVVLDFTEHERASALFAISQQVMAARFGRAPSDMIRKLSYNGGALQGAMLRGSEGARERGTWCVRSRAATASGR